MSVKVANSRFIGSSIEKWTTLYLAKSVSEFHQLGSHLVLESEKAQALRKPERLKGLSLILSQIPIQEYQLIGQFYEGYSKTASNSQRLFEMVVEKSETYRSKALIALATLEVNSGDSSSGFKLYSEAIRHSRTPSVTLHAARSIAVLRGLDGLHRHALKDLDHIASLVRHSSPIAQYQYLNSLAVELGSVKRIEEAQNVCRITLASPYAFAYPEWRETEQELALRGYKSRSSVQVKTIPGNIAYLPDPSPATGAPVKSGRARVLSIEKWKEEKMVKQPNGDEENEENLDEMEEKDLMVKLLYLATKEGKNVNRLRKVVAYAVKVFSEPED